MYIPKRLRADPTQIERPAPRLQICPVCKQPSHLGCDHAVVEFKADLREKLRQANRASREKAKEIKARDNIAPVENTKESDSGSAVVEKPKLNAVGKPCSESYDPNYKVRHRVGNGASPSGGALNQHALNARIQPSSHDSLKV